MNTNLVQIAQVAASECVRQHVGLNRLVTLLDAYRQVVSMDVDSMSAFFQEKNPERFIRWLAGEVEPDNQGRFRTTPVTFANGGTAAPASEVPRLVAQLCAIGDSLTADEWTKEFLWIHPFSDGNGRTGWILYNILSGTMDNPVPLPKFFGED